MEVYLFAGRVDGDVKPQRVHVTCMTSILFSTSIQYHLLLLSLGMRLSNSSTMRYRHS